MPTKPLLSPLFAVRCLPCAACFLLVLAMLFKRPELHSMCVGAALGVLIGACVFSFGIESIVLKNKPQPSDVKHYPIA